MQLEDIEGKTCHEGENTDEGPSVDIPPYCRCPLTEQLMLEPVFFKGKTYEREALQDWINTRGTVPHSHQAIPIPPVLTVNEFAKGMIADFIQHHPAAQSQQYVPKQQRVNRAWLTLARQGGSRDAFERLLQVSPAAEPLTQDRQGNSALLLALNHERFNTVKALQAALSSGREANEASDEKSSVERSCPSMWPGLLALANKRGQGPLHVAVAHQMTEAIDFLMAQGAAVDQPDSAGQTALHQAVLRRYEPAALQLVRAGAACDTLDQNQKSPLDYAESTLVQRLNAARNDYLSQCMRQQQTELDKVRRINTTLNERALALTTDKQQLSEQVRTLTTDKQQLTHQVQVLTADKQQLTHQVQVLTADKQRLKQGIEEREEKSQAQEMVLMSYQRKQQQREREQRRHTEKLCEDATTTKDLGLVLDWLKQHPQEAKRLSEVINAQEWRARFLNFNQGKRTQAWDGEGYVSYMTNDQRQSYGIKEELLRVGTVGYFREMVWNEVERIYNYYQSAGGRKAEQTYWNVENNITPLRRKLFDFQKALDKVLGDTQTKQARTQKH